MRLGEVTSYTYNANEQVTSITQPRRIGHYEHLRQ